jgi:hypothetical protein
VLGYFSITEITDPGAHEAYNAWHQLDHMPEQFTIDGISFGQRWVRSPRCRAAEAATGDRLATFHYMTLYLMRDEQVVPPFFALAEQLHAQDRFFGARRALLSGPFAVVGRWAAPRVAVSPGAVPFRPSNGIYVVVGPAVDGEGLVDHAGVAGCWQFADAEGERAITVAFVDGDPLAVAATVADVGLDAGPGGWGPERAGPPEWAGPLERVDAFRWDWFAPLMPQ